jgi:hypothetical protein
MNTNMDIDISDDLQELRERVEVMAVSRDDAAIITRAALEIARLRGKEPVTKEKQVMWTTFGTAAPQRVEIVEEMPRGTTMILYRGSNASVPSDTLFATETEAWLAMCAKAAADMELLHRRLDYLHREYDKAKEREESQV